MNDIENRLRDSLGARADAVTADPHAYERVVARRARRRVRAWGTVGAAGLAAAAVVGVVAVVPRHDDARPVPPVTGTKPATPAAPREFLAISRGHATLFDATRPHNSSSFNTGGYTVLAVAARGDGHHFAVAEVSTRDSCTSQLVFLDSDGAASTAIHDDATVRGHVTGIAMSPDGRQVAYVVGVRAGSTGACDRTELRVRDVATGAERTWTDGYPASTVEMGGSFVEWLSWAPDSRHLAYTADLCCDGAQGVRVLDTLAPGRSFLAPPSHGENIPGATDDVACRLVAPAYRGTTGQLTAVRDCIFADGSPDVSTVVVIDPATGAVRRDLFVLPGGGGGQRIAFDRSGAHALIERGDGDAVERLERWDGGAVRPLDTGRDKPTYLTW